MPKVPRIRWQENGLFSLDSTRIQNYSEMTSSAKESLPKFTLLVTQGPLSGKTYAMSGNSFRIGRTKSSKLQIKDPSISERHAEMIYLECCWQVRDLGSSNGTSVNGKKVDGMLFSKIAIVPAGMHTSNLLALQHAGTFVKLGSGDVIGFGTETVATIEVRWLDADRGGRRHTDFFVYFWTYRLIWRSMGKVRKN